MVCTTERRNEAEWIRYDFDNENAPAQLSAWQASRESLINSLEPIACMCPSIGKSDCVVITKSAEESENIEVFFDSHGLPFKVHPLYHLD